MSQFRVRAKINGFRNGAPSPCRGVDSASGVHCERPRDTESGSSADLQHAANSGMIWRFAAAILELPCSRTDR